MNQLPTASTALDVVGGVAFAEIQVSGGLSIIRDCNSGAAAVTGDRVKTPCFNSFQTSFQLLTVSGLRRLACHGCIDRIPASAPFRAKVHSCPQ